jgi:4-hydroxy-tetrahydrodipicolinate synthase
MVQNEFKGCYTALITPMKENFEIDWEGLKKLVDFQISQGVSGILAMGTTSESPTVSWEEHNKVTEKVFELVDNRCIVIAGTGSNSTKEAVEGTEHAHEVGARAVLLVDPYYNGPSSLEIRKEYVEPVLKKFPDIQVIYYVIPGRSGTQLLPHDMAILHKQYPNNFTAVKEATGKMDNMKLTRQLCGESFIILSGDDNMTYEMMVSDVKAAGVISVISNIVPKAVQKMCMAVLEGDDEKSKKLADALAPLFEIVTVKTEEDALYEGKSFGKRTVKARNPVPIKTAASILGMPSGSCRQPLGKMTKQGLGVVLNALKTVYEKNPEILKPIEDAFGVDLKDRLYNEENWRGLCYE